MKEELLQAGDVEIKECSILKANGEGLDIKAQLASVTIYEDIYSPFITGFITMIDTQDIPGTIGRSGRDLLKLHIYTPSLDKQYHISGFFIIYKIGEREQVKNRMQQYNIYFASEEYMLDVNQKISKTYTGSAEAAVTSIVRNKLTSTKNILVEPTSNSLSYTSNFWAPSRNLSHIADHTLSSNGNANMLFYENRFGFNLASFDTLAQSSVKPIQKFDGNDFASDIKTDQDNKITFGQSTRNPIKDYKVIQELRVDTTFDFFNDYNNGMIKTKMYSHDLVTKKFGVKNFDITTDKASLLNKNRFYRDNIVSSMDPILMFMPKHYNLFDNKDSTDHAWHQKRNSQLLQYRASVIEIDVFGRTDYTVGQKVEVYTNRLKSITKEEGSDEFLDKLYSGMFIITAITHNIDRVKHMCTLELSKNSTLLS
jgi:hypothetical protein